MQTSQLDAEQSSTAQLTCSRKRPRQHIDPAWLGNWKLSTAPLLSHKLKRSRTAVSHLAAGCKVPQNLLTCARIPALLQLQSRGVCQGLPHLRPIPRPWAVVRVADRGISLPIGVCVRTVFGADGLPQKLPLLDGILQTVARALSPLLYCRSCLFSVSMSSRACGARKIQHTALPQSQ